MNPPESTAGRLQRLEASLAHLERLADQLNEALVAQGRELARLQKRLDLMTEALTRRDEEPPPTERPPHYGR